MYSISFLIEQLKALGIEENDLITVHTSLKKIGETENRGEGVITALRTAVKDGILFIPAHTWDKVWESQLFDVKSTRPCTGMLSCLAVEMANEAVKNGDTSIRRSLHPTHSVVAFGKNAIEYIKDDESVETAIPEKSSYGKLLAEKGKILLLGVDLTKNTFFHTVEEFLADKLLEQHNITVVDYNGTKTARKMCSTYGASSDFEKYRDCLIKAGALSYGKFGDADVIVCDAQKSFNALVAYEKNNK